MTPIAIKKNYGSILYTLDPYKLYGSILCTLDPYSYMGHSYVPSAPIASYMGPSYVLCSDN